MAHQRKGEVCITVLLNSQKKKMYWGKSFKLGHSTNSSSFYCMSHCRNLDLVSMSQ